MAPRYSQTLPPDLCIKRYYAQVSTQKQARITARDADTANPTCVKLFTRSGPFIQFTRQTRNTRNSGTDDDLRMRELVALSLFRTCFRRPLWEVREVYLSAGGAAAARGRLERGQLETFIRDCGTVYGARSNQTPNRCGLRHQSWEPLKHSAQI